MQSDPKEKPEEQRRARPHGMPTQAPPSKPNPLGQKEAPQNDLPSQKPVTDEEETLQKPAKWKKVLVRVLTVILLIAALALVYVFLLLGEPDEDSQFTQQAAEEQIKMPMSALESPGEANTASLAQTFGQPVMYLYGSGLTMERSRIYDTAFGGGYARRATLSYAFEDGQLLRVESIRPTAAITLLNGSGYSLDSDSLYAIGGVDAAWMENSETICVFGQTDTAAYAVVCPASHRQELETLLKQTALIAADGEK